MGSFGVFICAFGLLVPAALLICMSSCGSVCTNAHCFGLQYIYVHMCKVSSYLSVTDVSVIELSYVLFLSV